MDFIKTKFGDGDDEFRLRAEGSGISSLVKVETNPVIRIRKLKVTADNIVNQSSEIVNSDQDDDIPSEFEAANDRSGEELNGIEHVEVAIEAVEPTPGPSRGKSGQKKKKRHTRQDQTNAAKVGFTVRTQEHRTTTMGTLTQSARKRFVCDWADCGKRFRLNANLSTHKRVHTGEKPFICDWPDCQKAFSQLTNLRDHKRVHTGEKPFTCDWPDCQKGFSQNASLNNHKRTHTGEKHFICTYCSGAFARKYTLEGHVRIHTGETPFTCNLCGKSFKSKSHLNQHKRLHA